MATKSPVLTHSNGEMGPTDPLSRHRSLDGWLSEIAAPSNSLIVAVETQLQAHSAQPPRETEDIPYAQGTGPKIDKGKANEQATEVPVGVSQLLRDAASICHEFPTASACIYPHKGKKNLWFGKPWEVPVPEILDQNWNDPEGIKARLDIDLEPARLKIIRKASQKKLPRPEREFNAELRMSGYTKNSRAPSVTLSPCVWIFGGSDWVLRYVKRALKDISWITSFLGRPVELCVGGARPCAKPSLISLDQLRWHSVSQCTLEYGGGQIFYHIAKLEPNFSSISACGWLCCASYMKGGELLDQKVSRIGGILTREILGDDLHHYTDAAITTAHGVLESAEPDIDPIETYPSDDSFSLDSELDQEPETKDENTDEDEDEDGNTTVGSVNEDKSNVFAPPSLSQIIGDIDPSKAASDWIPFDDVSAINFLGNSIGTQPDGRQTKLAISDYTVLKSDAVRLLHNIYMLKSSGSGVPRIETINTRLSNDELVVGPIQLILGFTEVEEAHLLTGKSTLHLGSQVVNVRKVQLRAPLAQGTSGTWLVRGGSWCGMVIACYPEEPLALFITAEDILSDIASSFCVTYKASTAEWVRTIHMNAEALAGGEGQQTWRPADGETSTVYSETLLKGQRLTTVAVDSKHNLNNRTRVLACPYFQRDPEQYQNQRICSSTGFTDIHRLKEHLFRRHRLPPYCSRCYQTFKNETMLQIHHRADPICALALGKPPQGFNEQQEAKLRKRVQLSDQAERWRYMYRILFPDDDRKMIPYPYYVYPYSIQELEVPKAVERFWVGFSEPPGYDKGRSVLDTLHHSTATDLAAEPIIDSVIVPEEDVDNSMTPFLPDNQDILAIKNWVLPLVKEE